jgi:hypothetical protein
VTNGVRGRGAEGDGAATAAHKSDHNRQLPSPGTHRFEASCFVAVLGTAARFKA